MSKDPRMERQKTRKLDEALSKVEIPPSRRGGWIGAIRQALGMNQAQLAKRMAIARPTLARLEKNEIRGAATLASLQRAADALGCELKYVLVPKKPLREMIDEQALRRAKQKIERINQSQALEASALKRKSVSETTRDLANELSLTRPRDLWNDQ